MYYEITYTCQGEEMTENGVAYVWLRDEAPDDDDADCPCGCGKPDCDCQDKDCTGGCQNSGCGDGHNFTKLEAVPASCLGLGYARYLCADCGKVEKRDYTAALGHAWQSIVIREADCETDGKILETCRRCGETNVVSSPKGEHRYEAYSVAATCTMPGHTVRECAVCGDRHITNITAALPHKYQAQTIPAGCESGGRTVHCCAGCGSSFVTDYTAPLGHSWDEGHSVTVSTCTGQGVTEYRCVRCGFHRLEASAAEGHTPGPAAGCETAQLCTQCGAVIQAALGHHITENVTAATCEDMGYTAYTCENCGLSYKTDYLQALGHDYAAAVTDPTCTAGGFTTHTCTRCGESYTDTPTEALGHDWDAGTKLTSPTCNTEGLLEHHCTRCDASYLEALSPAGHKESGWIVDKEPTAFDEGHRHRECEHCGAVLEQETLDKLGNTGDTDGRGEANVGGYLVIVTDTNTGDPVANAHVVLNRDHTFSIRLPRGRLLDSEKQTTVTILLKKDRSPLSGLGVTVTDRNDNRSTGRTNVRGQLTVPTASGSTGGNTTVGGKDENDEKLTLTVKVSDYESGRTIGDAVVTISKDGRVTVKLPRREKMDADNRILVTVTDHRKRPLAGIDVTVKDSQGQSAGGETDKDGKLVVPAGKARHSAYIVGYPDGTFGPGRTMTRAEASAIFARLLAEKKEEKIPAAAYTRFRDVPFASWYSGYVQYLGGYGVVVGRTGGVFAPDAPITRAEFTAMAVRFLAAYGTEKTALFNDYFFYDVAASDWSASYIQEAALHGWVIGYGDGTFRGEVPISRAEAVTLVNRLLEREADEAYIEKNLRSLYTFVDLGKNHWAYWAVMEAANAHTAKTSNPEAWSK